MDEEDRMRSDERDSDGTDLAGDRIGNSDSVSDSDTGNDESNEHGGGGSHEVDQISPGSDVTRSENSGSSEIPDRTTQREDTGGDGFHGLWYRFRHDREGALMWVREILSSIAVVLAIGLILFGISGVWPPMVAVESGSMEPNMEVGDLVFVTEPGRFAPDAANDNIGVVTYDVGERADYRTFGSYGSVVIYQPPGRTASPIIHRAMFHVEAGENWYDRADNTYHSAESCGDLRHCPAPHSGYITLGDNNGVYDQAQGIAAPVKRGWVTGVARVRIPYLGYVRLVATDKAEPGDAIDAVAWASA